MKEEILWNDDYAKGKVILIDKPLTWTSFDVVKKIRGSVRISKVGHAGTLDPLATGLLIVCTGKFTKQINTYQAAEKEYKGSFVLGSITDSYDLETKPKLHGEIGHITPDMIHAATNKFIGEIMQVPPIYSAIKKEGTPAYVLARKGKEVKMEARPITIKSFEITSIDLPKIEFKVVCSTGTYIRSLAFDYGNELGCGAYLSSLRRTRIGEFTVNQAMDMEQFIKELDLIRPRIAEKIDKG